MSETVYEIYCLRCMARYPEMGEYLNVCPRCGGILDVRYDSDRRREVLRRLVSSSELDRGLWRWAELLPLRSPVHPVTLGEGDTALIQSRRIAAELGGIRLYLKDESRNPTGSFKDRPVSVAISKALELGYQGVVTASSGNAGAAVAAYAARAGIKCYVCVPGRTPPSKLGQIALYGANVLRVGGSYSDAFAEACRLAAEKGLVNVTTTFRSPYPTEANKTIAYELHAQLGGEVPDWVVAPVGSGPLPVGVLKGYEELKSAGLIAETPRLLGVQSKGCAPVTRAFENGTPVTAWERPDTIASGIADALRGYEQDGDLTVLRVRESGGRMVAVDDSEILAGATTLARDEGIGAEPTGAAGIAGVKALARNGGFSGGELVVVLVTGHALKDVGAILN